MNMSIASLCPTESIKTLAPTFKDFICLYIGWAPVLILDNKIITKYCRIPPLPSGGETTGAVIAWLIIL